MQDNQNIQKEILEEEKEILKETKEILEKQGKEASDLKSLERRTNLMMALIGLLFVGLIGGGIYWYISQKSIYIEKAEISATRIELAPQNSGILEDVLVNEGDQISANTPVARVGNELIKSKISGTIIEVHNNIGKLINRGEAVVVMIDPNDLRVIGRIAEDKGLSELHIGQNAIFTVDAFGSSEYSGVVDEISPESRNSDIVFSISDKREAKEFNIKIKFDIAAHPEFRQGMSAKIWIYKK